MKIEELKQQRIWLCASEKKAPCLINSRGMGGHDNPAEWGTYAEAVKAAKHYNLPMVGLCLGEELAGVDFDHVRNPETGQVVPEVLRLIEMLDTYTEISKSGTGFHVLMRVNPQRVGLKNRGDKAVNSWVNPAQDGQLSKIAYGHPVLTEDGKKLDGSRFYVFTGNVFNGRDEINERTSQFISLAAAYPPAESEEKRPAPAQQQELSKRAYQLVELTDDIWDKLESNKKLSDLFEGNAQPYVKDYTNGNAVDWAFVGEALQTFNWDGNIVYSLWAASELMRDKCSRKYEGGKTDYMGYTIQRYINMNHGSATAQANREAAKNREPRKRSISYHKDGSPDNVLEYLTGDWYKLAIDGVRKYADRLTGFEGLDKIQPLYPGLYVFGAGSSMGKTTFMHQMADQLAERGEHVIFFSMEQTRVQMVSKSLSRIMYKEQQENRMNYVLPAIDIYSGKANPSPSSIEKYKKYAGRVHIVECTFETIASDIMQYVEDFMQQNPGIKPVVFVDYLQIIPPEVENSKSTAIETASQNIKALKNFQKNHDLVVFVISSLNRANYYIPLDFESFKNSGDIEYSADCVWGLELAVIQAKIFEDEGSNKGRKRKIAAKEKAKEFRRLRLVCLKNRFGLSNYSVEFQYVPKFDTFECHSWGDVDWENEYPPEEKPKKGQTEQERKTIAAAEKEVASLAKKGGYFA